MQHLHIDGVEYRVRIVYGSLARAFEVVEGPNSGTSITGRRIRDIFGTAYAYTMDIEPDPRYPTDYDLFYNLISSPAETHHVVMPYGQTTLDFDAYILSGEDKLGANIGGFVRWHGLRIAFKPIEPQREV